jgi:hypothetical protein
MKEIGARGAKLQNIYTREMNKIRTTYDEKIGQISQWFHEQQNTLRAQKGELGVMKGRDLAALSQNLLNQALAEINFIREQAANKQSMLDQWALNNATTIEQARANLEGVASEGFGQVNPAQPLGTLQLQGGNITAPNTYVPGGGTAPTEEEENVYKRPLGLPYSSFIAESTGGPIF